MGRDFGQPGDRRGVEHPFGVWDLASFQGPTPWSPHHGVTPSPATACHTMCLHVHFGPPGLPHAEAGPAHQGSELARSVQAGRGRSEVAASLVTALRIAVFFSSTGKKPASLQAVALSLNKGHCNHVGVTAGLLLAQWPVEAKCN